ncbi:GTPase [Undibacterium sp.]|uniref:GTPase n=1 Tax=Undibacterium sp. TaxID=1914977 RepID=UPI0037506F8B
MANAANKPTTITLVAGGSYAEREAWIAATLQNLFQQHNPKKFGALLEGLPTGSMALQVSPSLSVERIAPGCFCCIGQIAMRVSLNRLLRQQLAHLFIAINDAQHLTQLHNSLSNPPYVNLVNCADVVQL